MTQEEWKKYRVSEELPLEVFYEYYLDKKDPDKEILPLDMFNQLFPLFFRDFGGTNMQFMTSQGVKIKQITYAGAIVKIINHFNKKYEGDKTEGSGG